MKQFFILLGLGLLSAASCKKAKDVTSREDQLRGESGWTQTSGRVKYRVPGTNVDSNVDYWSRVDSCYRDNKFIFKAINDGTLESGMRRCDIGEPSQRTFFWQLLEGDEVLEINYIGDAFFGVEPLRAQIKEFNGSTMVLEYTARDTIFGQNQPTTFTYTNGYSK